MNKPWAPDPCYRENVMYTGHLLQLLALYEWFTHDRRYWDAGFDFVWNPQQKVHYTAQRLIEGARTMEVRRRAHRMENVRQSVRCRCRTQLLRSAARFGFSRGRVPMRRRAGMRRSSYRRAAGKAARLEIPRAPRWPLLSRPRPRMAHRRIRPAHHCARHFPWLIIPSPGLWTLKRPSGRQSHIFRRRLACQRPRGSPSLPVPRRWRT